MALAWPFLILGGTTPPRSDLFSAIGKTSFVTSFRFCFPCLNAASLTTTGPSLPTASVHHLECTAHSAIVCGRYERSPRRLQASLPRHHVSDGRRPILILRLSHLRLVSHTQPIHRMYFGIRITPCANQLTATRASRAKSNSPGSLCEGMRPSKSKYMRNRLEDLPRTTRHWRPPRVKR
ncbi:hypothetical protein EV421DRAFT_973666 [Armillaria borealis]|uniref:Uncharacterized protein n=1 Tax=Armillaria borealis TaxID=47425 RepID=A0AA39JAJ1_9AGAR|nr:hypothetical protein EV421DRAFT_973666 [Armillaria borealis]